jgi:hypothetical protein
MSFFKIVILTHNYIMWSILLHEMLLGLLRLFLIVALLILCFPLVIIKCAT